MTRRDALRGMATASSIAAVQGRGWGAEEGMAKRFAICSETFQEEDFGRTCGMAAELGYRGIELDPSTLADDPVALSGAERSALRRSMQTSGLAYVGLHNALKSRSRKLHLTTSDDSQRKATWEYFRQLVDLAADLASGSGESPVIVLGSGKQRDAIDGVTPAAARARVADGLAALAPHAEARGVRILLEPLAPHLSNIFHTLAETTEVVRQIGSPSIQTIFDTHNTAAESESIEQLVARYRGVFSHVHVNEMDGRYPGAADYPFARLLAALEANGYRGWISVEIFAFEPSGIDVARRSIENLRRWAATLP